LAATIQETLGLEATLAEGDRGEFSVWVDGTCIADKDLKRCEEFPDEGELLNRLKLLTS
jgi:hypothetical protein